MSRTSLPSRLSRALYHPGLVRSTRRSPPGRTAWAGARGPYLTVQMDPRLPTGSPEVPTMRGSGLYPLQL